MKKIILDDGYQNHLTDGALFEGAAGIPKLLEMHNNIIPDDIISFDKAKSCQNKRKYVHFYLHDYKFNAIFFKPEKYLKLLGEYDGIITPDPTMLIGQSKCLLESSTYFNRAVGVYFQKHGIPVIPNVRWTDQSSYEYCFLGVPHNSIVAISTHGCIRTKEEKVICKNGLEEMLFRIKPKVVLVHGFMPGDVFGEYSGQVEFRRYPSQFELTHQKGGEYHGIRA